MDWNELPRGHRVGLVAALVVVVGALGPWVSVLGTTSYGFLMLDGWLIAVTAIVAGVGLAFIRPLKARAWTAGIAFALAALLSFASFLNLVVSLPTGMMSWGPFLALAASVVGFAAVMMGNAAAALRPEDRGLRA